jgi:hypothetical protein
MYSFFYQPQAYREAFQALLRQARQAIDEGEENDSVVCYRPLKAQAFIPLVNLRYFVSPTLKCPSFATP